MTKDACVCSFKAETDYLLQNTNEEFGYRFIVDVCGAKFDGWQWAACTALYCSLHPRYGKLLLL